MTARRWDGTAWVPLNELLSRFGDAQGRPVIKHYQDGVFGLGWYPLRSIKRWDGTAWVNVWQARQPAPLPPPKPDPITGITPPPPPPPPVQGPVIFNDEGIPMELNEAGEIVPYNQTPGNFDTSFTDLGDDIATVNAGSFAQQQALIRRTTGNLDAAWLGSLRRTVRIIAQRNVFSKRIAILHGGPYSFLVLANLLRRTASLYRSGFDPSRSAVNSFIALINSATGVRNQFDSVAALATDVGLLRTAIVQAAGQRDAETTANNRRTVVRNNLRGTYNLSRLQTGPLGIQSIDLPFLPPSSGD